MVSHEICKEPESEMIAETALTIWLLFHIGANDTTRSEQIQIDHRNLSANMKKEGLRMCSYEYFSSGLKAKEESDASWILASSAMEWYYKKKI